MPVPLRPMDVEPSAPPGAMVQTPRADRAESNRVRYGVRNLALLKEQFTVGEIVEETGFNSSSVHTEVQRMKREGLLEVAPNGARRRPVTYRVRDVREARVRLVRSIQAFLP